MKGFIFILLILLLGCINHDNPQPYPPATPASCVRVGAVCNDNTTTSHQQALMLVLVMEE